MSAAVAALRGGARTARRVLQPGDIVDVVAPGFRCSAESLARGVEFLRGLGLEPRVPRSLFGADVLCANSDRARFEHLRRALYASDSRCLWCVRGGYGAMRLVARLIKLAPPPRRKLFIGYSDATTLHYLLNHHWRWPSLHGPLLDRLGSGSVPDEELEELKAVLLGGKDHVEFAGLTPLNAAARARRLVRSRLFGGNLTVLQTTLGTALQRRPRQILFLEDVGERGYRVDRMLQHLAQAGALRNLEAVVLGAFTGGQEPDGRTLVPQVLERFAREQRFPVLKGMDAGHGALQRPVFFNTPVELTCGANPRLSIASASL
ncbi:MAG TPA: LD-carboxypeptidase [Steroidobacteraceae bacterium]|nr:LD-carboxypeptidase [Steroidobacteraceae bacterium]